MTSRKIAEPGLGYLEVTGREARVLAAICAVAVGILICTHQRHFVWVPWVWKSWTGMLVHRCGMVFAAALLWASVECVALMVARLRVAQRRVVRA